MKWLKNGSVKCLYFMQLFLHYILFGEHFIIQVKVPSYSVCLGRLNRWWYLSKPLTITITSFNFVICPVKL